MSQVIKVYSSVPPITVPIDFYTDDGNFAVAQANRLNVYGLDGAFTTSDGAGTGNTVYISSILWMDEGVSFPAVKNHGYFCTAAITATLPNAPTNGTTIIIYNATANLEVTIKAQGTDEIEISGETSAAAGTATNEQQGANVELIYRSTDGIWHGLNVTGTWTVT
jgi:hypothetical protein